MNRRNDNACTAKRYDERWFARDARLRPGEKPPLASHLVTHRTLYSHHGIYIGNGRVIHYAGLEHGFRRGPVEEVSLEHFSSGRGVRIRRDPSRFDRSEVVERARSRLGECRYRLLTNNCEHFCTWALCGEGRSRQAERLRALPRPVWRMICAIIERGFALPTNPTVSTDTIV